MNSVDTTQKLEALLFSEGGALSKKKLMQLLEIDAVALQVATSQLAYAREGSALTVIESETEIALATRPELKSTLEHAYERELGREIGDAGLEVLSIVLYRGPSTRAQIDYIRGVNTSSTIRNLTARGLLERVPNPTDAREYLYRPTVELLAHLGVTKGDELPEYGKISNELAAFEETKSPFEDTYESDTNTGNPAI